MTADWMVGMAVATPMTKKGSTTPDLVALGRFRLPHYFGVVSRHPALPFEVRMEVEVDRRSRTARCRVLTCVDLDSEEAVTGGKLRAIPVASLLRAAILMAAEDAKGLPADWQAGGEAEVAKAYGGRDEGARWALTDNHLREVAQVYRDAVLAHDRAPVQAVVEHFGKKRGARVPSSTAARWVLVARNEKGFLGKTTSGKSGELERPPRKPRRKDPGATP